MNAKEYLPQIVQKLQLLDDLGEEPSSLRIIEHMNLAVAFYRLHEIEHGIEISLEHFHCAKSLSNYILLQETDPSGSFHEFFITCIRYGSTIYQLGDAYVNDAESIFLFTQIFINLGTICMRQMQLDNAEIHLFKALNICKNATPIGCYLKDEILVLVNLAWLYISQNLYDRTQFYADSAADLISRNTETNNIQLQIELYLIYANIQYQNGNLEESIQLIDKAIAKAGHTRLLLFNCYYFIQSAVFLYKLVG